MKTVDQDLDAFAYYEEGEAEVIRREYEVTRRSYVDTFIRADAAYWWSDGLDDRVKGLLDSGGTNCFTEAERAVKERADNMRAKLTQGFALLYRVSPHLQETLDRRAKAMHAALCAIAVEKFPSESTPALLWEALGGQGDRPPLQNEATAEAAARKYLRSMTSPVAALRDEVLAHLEALGFGTAPRGKKRPVPFLYGYGDGPGGQGQLVLELLPGGRGEFYPHPFRMGLFPASPRDPSPTKDHIPDFYKAAEQAGRIAGDLVGGDRPGDIRWYVERGGIPLPIGGPSISALQAAAAVMVWKDFAIDARRTVTGWIRNGGVIAQVGHEEAKAKAWLGGSEVRRMGVPKDSSLVDEAVTPLPTLEDAVAFLRGDLEDIDRIITGQLGHIEIVAKNKLQFDVPGGDQVGIWERFHRLYVPLTYRKGWKQSREPDPAKDETDPIEAEEQARADQRPPVTWSTAVGDAGEHLERPSTVVADAGFGKTFMLLRTVYNCCVRAQERMRSTDGPVSPRDVDFGVFVTASQLARGLKPNITPEAALKHLIREVLDTSVPAGDAPKAEFVLGEALRAGKCLVAIDGLDEAGSDCLREFFAAVRGAGLRLLISARRMTYLPEHTAGVVTDDNHLEAVHGFTPGQVTQYVSTFFREEPAREEWSERALKRIQASASVNPILEAPLLLQHACAITYRDLTSERYDNTDLPPWNRRVELYDEFLGLVADRFKQRCPENIKWLAPAELLEVVARIALECRRKDARAREFPEETFRSALNRAYGRTSGSSVRDIMLVSALREALEHLAILQHDVSSQQWEFQHRSFCDFLAGWAIADRINNVEGGWNPTLEWKFAPDDPNEPIEALLNRVAWDPDWWETIRFVAGCLDDPTPLLRMLHDPRRDDAGEHGNLLALLCTTEIDRKDYSFPGDAPA